MTFRAELHRRAAALRRRVVLAEGGDPRVARAAGYLEAEGIATVIVLDGVPGDEPRLPEAARLLHRRRGHRVRGYGHALDLVSDPIRFAAALVGLGEADAAVGGANCPTAEVARAALWLVGPAPGIHTVSSSFYMILESPAAHPDGPRVLTFTDCGVVPTPSPQQLAEIALCAAADRRRIVGDEPVVAFLSYSTKGSASGPRIDAVVEAMEKFRELAPDIRADGELQGDAALVPEIAARKAPESPVGGTANVLVFPDLDSGNIAYKLVQRLAAAGAIGPILQGLAKPVADLSRGASWEDVVDVAAVAILQSE